MSKTKFPCGHRGKGKFCHRCANEAKPPKAAPADDFDDRPVICQDCGNDTDYCTCITVDDFRVLSDVFLNRTIEKIKKQLGEPDK